MSLETLEDNRKLIHDREVRLKWLRGYFERNGKLPLNCMADEVINQIQKEISYLSPSITLDYHDSYYDDVNTLYDYYKKIDTIDSIIED